MKKYTYHKDGTLPRPDGNVVFVFGSNLAGVHGAGAAKIAKLNYDYPIGIGFGLSNTDPIELKGFAIPTKDRNIQTLPLKSILKYVSYFKNNVAMHQEFNYFVTRIGCGLAGYKDSDIAPMFRGVSTNCSFAEEWEIYLENMVEF